jgi:ATP-dependent exoDNAse (exonuclease V) beta subunit
VSDGVGTNANANADADAEARLAVATRLDQTLFVEAGAGTGKTTALVGRIQALVEQGVDMRGIAAITFTEAAAAELRHRVRAALEEAARAGRVTTEAVAQVDEAAIATLHAFAQRLLAEYPLEAGLPPSFEVLDEIQASIEFDQRWSAFVDRLLDDPAYEDALLRGLAVGLNLRDLRDVAAALADHDDRLAEAGLAAGPGWRGLSQVDPRSLITAMQEAARFIPQCRANDDRLAQHLTRLADWAQRLDAASGRSEVELLHQVNALPALTCALGRQEQWACPTTDVRDACQAADEARLALLDGVRREVLGALLGALADFTRQGAGERARAGRLAFHDLLVRARDMLRNHPEVRHALSARYSHLLIDEFQDTDPLQVELAVLLTAEAASADGSSAEGWTGMSPAPGRLFFVGDAKQSIYRFRRADISLFLRVRAEMVDQPLQLSRNFRSVPGILAFVNHLFSALMGQGAPGAQAAYEPLSPGRTDGGSDDVRLGRSAQAHQPPVVLLGDERSGSMAQVREEEAADIAATVERIVREAWPVTGNNESGGRPRSRPANLSDIAILLPTRTSLPQLEAALEDADVPYRVESASLVWSTQEVRDLLAVLQAVDDPTDEVAVVAALRSPGLASGDDDLFAYRQAGGRWRVGTAAPDSLAHEHPVVAGMRTLDQLHRDRWWTTPSALVDRVIRELRLLELAFAHRRPRDHWRRLRWVLDQARAFEESGGTTLRAFLAWAERQVGDESRAREAVLPEADDDAVRILTVHGAKGLEFPVVVLSGLNRIASGGGGGGRVLWSEDGRPEAKAGRFQTQGFAALAERERDMDRHEQLRLLYVATTRARDHLVVSLHRKPGDRSQAAEVARVVADHPDLWRRLDAPFALVSQSAATAPTPDPRAAGRRREWDAERQERIARLRRAPVKAATTIAAASIDHAAGGTSGGDEPEPDAPPWRRGRAGTSIGRAVHAVLQSVDLASGDGAAELARAQAAAEGVDAKADEVERLARAALASAAVRQAVAHRHWREVYVAAPVGDLTIEGFVDLLYETPDGLVVVDYKTDTVRSDAELDSAVDRYRLQAAAYALALERSLGTPVARCTFVFVSGGKPRQRDVRDLPGAVAEVESMVRASMAPV